MSMDSTVYRVTLHMETGATVEFDARSVEVDEKFGSRTLKWGTVNGQESESLVYTDLGRVVAVTKRRLTTDT